MFKKVFIKTKKFFRLMWSIIRLLIHRLFTNDSESVAQVVNSFNAGGLEQVAANIYNGFLNNGDGSYIISISNNVGPICQQIQSPADFRIVYYDIVDFLNFCRKKNIRTLLFHFSTFYMPLLKLLGFRNYYIIHNTYIWFSNNEWRSLKFKLKFCTGIIAVSDWSKDYFVKKTNIKNIKTILNGIDLNNLKNGDKTIYSREKLKIKNTDTVFLIIGAYIEAKHQLALIGIMEELLKIRKDIKFVCVGHVISERYNKLFLKKLSKSIAKKYIIPISYIPQKEMGSFIRNICDGYLQPSINEAGVPLSVMEAMASAKPIVMTDFAVEKSFHKVEYVYLAPTPYEDILKVTPKIANSISNKTRTIATKKFVDSIIFITDNKDKIKEELENNDFDFLSKEVMVQNYISYIKLNRK